jgi:hypothetical protein
MNIHLERYKQQIIESTHPVGKFSHEVGSDNEEPEFTDEMDDVRDEQQLRHKSMTKDKLYDIMMKVSDGDMAPLDALEIVWGDKSFQQQTPQEGPHERFGTRGYFSN